MRRLQRVGQDSGDRFPSINIGYSKGADIAQRIFDDGRDLRFPKTQLRQARSPARSDGFGSFRIEDLAARAQMSPSTLHHHFRQLTAMSPLQYQKWLRLNEARRLMLSEGRDAAEAAFHVGYESPSHFSRDHSRLFGTSPKRDIKALRQKAEGPARAASATNPHAGPAAPAPEMPAATLG
jgi:AraC-like DNA-binding protein